MKKRDTPALAICIAISVAFIAVIGILITKMNYAEQVAVKHLEGDRCEWSMLFLMQNSRMPHTGDWQRTLYTTPDTYAQLEKGCSK